jgi:hypothetical protein
MISFYLFSSFSYLVIVLQAEANYNMWKASYDELNAELIKDIQKLCADRNTFFDPCFSTVRVYAQFGVILCPRERTLTRSVPIADHPSGGEVLPGGGCHHHLAGAHGAAH